jgi:hypothetical protein
VHVRTRQERPKWGRAGAPARQARPWTAALVALVLASGVIGTVVQGLAAESAAATTSPNWSLSLTEPVADSAFNAVNCGAVGDCMAVGFAVGVDDSFNPTVLSTDDDGANWNALPAPAGLNEVLEAVGCVSADVCDVVGQNISTNESDIFATSDGGNTWILSDSIPSSYMDALACSSGGECVAVGGSETTGLPILLANSGGQTWTPVTATSDQGMLYDVACGSSLFCVATGQDNSTDGPLLYTTSDGGALWDAVSTTSDVGDWVGVSCPSSMQCTVTGQDDTTGTPIVDVTSDGGETWSAVATTVPTGVNALWLDACTSASDCFTLATTAGGEELLLSTTHGGTTWQDVNLPVDMSAFDGFGCDSAGTCFAAGQAETTYPAILTDYVAPPPAPTLPAPTTPTPTPASSSPGCSASGFGSASAADGYWLAESDGAVYACGNAPFFGSLTTQHVSPRRPIVGIAATPDGGGYWLVAQDGGVFAFGDARFFGSMAGRALGQPVVGITATPQGGYDEVAADGGVFTFGPGALFYGSMAGHHLNAPIVGITATAQGGYDEVAADGGVFTFGPDAPFWGSMNGTGLHQPIVGIAAAGAGYDLVGADGGVFTFNSAFHGSAGCLRLDQPVVGMAVVPGAGPGGTSSACGFDTPQAPAGYELAGGDGGVFSFGSAAFAGSLGGQGVDDIVGIAAS